MLIPPLTAQNGSLLRGYPRLSKPLFRLRLESGKRAVQNAGPENRPHLRFDKRPFAGSGFKREADRRGRNRSARPVFLFPLVSLPLRASVALRGRLDTSGRMRQPRDPLARFRVAVADDDVGVRVVGVLPALVDRSQP